MNQPATYASAQTPAHASPSEVARRLVAFYERLGAEREGALESLDDFFTADIHFRDPFRDTLGMAPFRELFVRMLEQYRTVRFTDFRVEGDDRAFTLTYDMHLRMAIGPTFVTPFVSVCRAREGKV